MEQRQLEKVVKEILGEAYVSLKIQRYVLTEDVTDHKAQIACALYLENSESYIGVDGVGVGMVDALFQGLKQALSTDYPSLNHINFVDFSISGDFSAREGNRSNSDVAGHVRLVVENTSHRRFRFESTSPSISASSVDVVLKAVEHFTNAEVAVLRVYDWIDDAKMRHRQDLVDKYVNRLTDLVKNATYSESIERRHQNL